MEAILQAKEISKTYHTGSVDVPDIKAVFPWIRERRIYSYYRKEWFGKIYIIKNTWKYGYTRYRQYINKRRGHNTYEGQEAVRFQKKKYRLYISGLQPVSRIYIIWKYSYANSTWWKKANDAKVDEILSELEISHCKNKYPSEMSGGEQQRVAIARALITSPAVIFADELQEILMREVQKQLQRCYQKQVRNTSRQ